VKARRLKILFLANRIPFPIRDGQTRRTYHILKGLAETHDVHLLSLHEIPEETRPETIEHLRTFCKTVDMVPAPSKRPSVGMIVRLLRSLVSRDPYTIWRHYSREYAKRVRAAAEATRFDVVHCDILPIAYAIRGIEARFCTFTDHDVSYLKARRMAEQQRNPGLRLFLRYEALKLKRLERWVFRHIDLGVVVSDMDREMLEPLAPACPLAVVENGVDVEQFTPDPSAVEPGTLLWLGGFNYYSNYEAVRYFLEDVYPSIKRSGETVKLYLVGSHVPERLKKLVGDDPSIVLTGYVDDPVPYLQRAAVFLAPILSGSGTKLKVLEAMAAGKPIVSTSIGVEGIAGRDGEHYVVADTAEDFSTRVVDLLRDPRRRERLAANARKLAEETYDWRIICDKTSKLYESGLKAVESGAVKRGPHTPVVNRERSLNEVTGAR
jgi:polysaccharide biosynthesis protein PslH